MKVKTRVSDIILVLDGLGLIILSTADSISPMTSTFLLGLGFVLFVVELVRAISYRKSLMMYFLIAFLPALAFFFSVIPLSKGDILITRDGRFVRTISHNLEFRIPGWYRLVWISNRDIGSSSFEKKGWIMVNYRSFRLRPAREITVFVRYKIHMLGTVYGFWQEAREKGFKYGDLSPYLKRMVKAFLRKELPKVIQEAVGACPADNLDGIKSRVEKRLNERILDNSLKLEGYVRKIIFSYILI